MEELEAAVVTVVIPAVVPEEQVEALIFMARAPQEAVAQVGDKDLVDLAVLVALVDMHLLRPKKVPEEGQLTLEREFFGQETNDSLGILMSELLTKPNMFQIKGGNNYV